MDSLIKLTIGKLAADGIDSCHTPLGDRQRAIREYWYNSSASIVKLGESQQV